MASSLRDCNDWAEQQLAIGDVGDEALEGHQLTVLGEDSAAALAEPALTALGEDHAVLQLEVLAPGERLLDLRLRPGAVGGVDQVGVGDLGVAEEGLRAG
jgi:hypothetical protein